MRPTVGVTLTTITHHLATGEIKKYRYWKARLQVDKRNRTLGHFRTQKEAVAAYRAAKKSLCTSAK